MGEMKRCSRGDECVHPDGPWLPATTEYFWVDKRLSSGLAAQCKVCGNHAARIARNDPERREAYLKRRKDEYARNRDVILQRQKIYNQRNKEAKRAYRKQWEKQNQARIKLKRHAYYEANKERVKANVRRNRLLNLEQAKAREKAWRLAHPERIRENQLRYNRRHPDRLLAHVHRRRARIKGAGGTYSREDIQVMYATQKGQCWWCGVSIADGYHIDHRIPIIKGGSNAPSNLCLSCPTCNARKGGKWSWEFNGRLL